MSKAFPRWFGSCGKDGLFPGPKARLIDQSDNERYLVKLDDGENGPEEFYVHIDGEVVYGGTPIAMNHDEMVKDGHWRELTSSEAFEILNKEKGKV